VRQRGDDLDPALAQPLGKIPRSGQQKNAEVRAVDHVFSPGDRALDQEAKVRVELGSAASDVDGVSARAIEGS
jgi:hypothetical protein